MNRLALFSNRRDPCLQLGGRTIDLGRSDVVIFALPRGGVIVAEQVAVVLGAPLDVVTVRTLVVPYRCEVAMGAIAESNLAVFDDAPLRRAVVRDNVMNVFRGRVEIELWLRAALYRSGRAQRSSPSVRSRCRRWCDHGSTTPVVCVAARALGATAVTVAGPVAVPEVLAHPNEPDDVICLFAPTGFCCVSLYYDVFVPTTNEEVLAALDCADEPRRTQK